MKKSILTIVCCLLAAVALGQNIKLNRDTKLEIHGDTLFLQSDKNYPPVLGYYEGPALYATPFRWSAANGRWFLLSTEIRPVVREAFETKKVIIRAKKDFYLEKAEGDIIRRWMQPKGTKRDQR